MRARLPAARAERVLVVGAAKRPARTPGLPGLLVTGDSLIQGVDAFLADRLQTAFDVTGDTHPGSRLIAPYHGSWATLARQEIARVHPVVTVMSLGTSDGIPIDGEACCSAAWQEAYEGRTRALMAQYRRGGRARVLWFTIPVPRGAAYAEKTHAINAAIREAASGQEGVVLVPLDVLLTPGERYRATMDVGGRPTRVRSDDGIHLSVAGAELVAGYVVDLLRRFRATG